MDYSFNDICFCYLRFLTPPQDIKKGIRGARPGVPHHRRQSSPDQDLSEYQEGASDSPPRSSSAASTSSIGGELSPTIFEGSISQSRSPGGSVTENGSVEENHLYFNSASHLTPNLPYVSSRACTNTPLQQTTYDINSNIKGDTNRNVEFNSHSDVKTNMAAYNYRDVTSQECRVGDSNGKPAPETKHEVTSPVNSSCISPSEKLSREFNNNMSFRFDHDNHNNNTAKYIDGNPS